MSVNGQWLLEYKHRIAYQEVTGLQIHGDLTLTNVAIIGSVINYNCFYFLES